MGGIRSVKSSSPKTRGSNDVVGLAKAAKFEPPRVKMPAETIVRASGPNLIWGAGLGLGLGDFTPNFSGPR